MKLNSIKKYYVLKFTIPENSYNAEKVNISDEDISSDYLKGISFKSKNVKITLYKNRGRLYNNIHNLFSIPIISENIKEIIEANSSDNEVEFYKVKVNMETNLQYYFINILDNIEAIDYDNSEYVELIEGFKVFKSLDKLVLIKKNLKDRNIFRLVNHELNIFISQLIKEKLEKLNLPELEFIPVEDFKWKL